MPHKPEISRTTLANMIEACLITVNKLEDAPPKANSQSTKELQCDYALWILNEGIEEEPIFIDETGVNLHAKRTRGKKHFFYLSCVFFMNTSAFYTHMIRAYVFISLQVEHLLDSERFQQ